MNVSSHKATLLGDLSGQELKTMVSTSELQKTRGTVRTHSPVSIVPADESVSLLQSLNEVKDCCCCFSLSQRNLPRRLISWLNVRGKQMTQS